MQQQAPGGYNGQILRVNLTNQTTKIEPIDPSFCRKYIGGAGFIAYYLLSEVPPGIDPLEPANKLIFAAGPLTGLTLGGCARHTVGSKSPLTGGIAKSEVGEHWGAQFKRAGFDALIIEGKSEKPVYLWIHNGEAAIRDAVHLWGQDTKATQETIRSELADPKVRVAMIGPGGENTVRCACLMHGPFDAAGRGGTGAVMGSKNLKAVAVRGDNLPPVVDNEGVKKMVNWLRENMELVKAFSDYGTGSPMPRFEQLGNLPIRNFRDGGFPSVDKISAVTIKETIRVGMDGCFGCPVRCKKVVACQEPYHVDRAYGGPEYETLGALGSACGIDDLEAIAKGNELCNAYSLDTISTGLSLAFAMECFEKGLLTSADTHGLELRFGNADAMLKTIELIARREGIGDLLAEGSARAAAQIGKGAEAFAIQVKKLELPMHEPRLSKGLALGYMVNPHGADHMDSLIDIFYCNFTEKPDVTVPDALPLGFEPVPYLDSGPRKVALFKALQAKRLIADSLVLCALLPYSAAQYAELTAAVTGWDTSVMEQFRIAERILTMCRLFNVREGFSAADDKLPQRFFGPTHGGALSDRSLDPDELEKAKRYYYYLMGWDDQGVPLAGKLEELGIERSEWE
ncbi:MAG: aldehyde ferredoxin oxidoreductase family protein [Desulfobacterales bacterium]|nr:MAG: aldehyde ferredoxin oxidoreductase family protein [Desulfobacterales bacterium]